MTVPFAIAGLARRDQSAPVNGRRRHLPEKRGRYPAPRPTVPTRTLLPAPQSSIAEYTDEIGSSFPLVTKNENKNENLFQNGSWKHNFDVLEIFLTHRQGFLGETSIF